MSRVPDICWSIECFRARLISESTESSNPESAESDTSSNMSVQVLDQADCDDPSCVEHGMGDSPDEEENVETSNNNGKVSIKSPEKLLLNQSEEIQINLLQNLRKNFSKNQYLMLQLEIWHPQKIKSRQIMQDQDLFIYIVNSRSKSQIQMA